MLKQSYIGGNNNQNQMYLYDKVREDLFNSTATKNSNKKSKLSPSITAIILLQLQAYIIKLLTKLPSKSSYQNKLIIQRNSNTLLFNLKLDLYMILIQSLHWILLLVLLLFDNIARFLNVDREMKEFVSTEEQQQDVYYQPKNKVVENEDDADYTNELVVVTSPNNAKRNISSNNNTQQSNPLISPSSPINSPTPNFVLRQRKSLNNISTTNNNSTERIGHIRSLSNNMVDQKKPMSPQKLRRVTAQREITVQNAVLPIQPRPSKQPHHHHHSHHHPKKTSTSNSVISHSSSGSSSTTKETVQQSNLDFPTVAKPKMQKTMSLTTAQQYQKQQQQQQHHHQHHNECKNLKQINTKPYERCCSACALSTQS